MIPYQDPLDLGQMLDIGELKMGAAQLIELLEGHISERRRARIDEVVAGRTYSVVPVLDGIHDTGNVAAVLRSTEALGYQAVHVIERQDFQKRSQRVTQGADKWLDIHRWSQPAGCIAELKRQGYQICVTHLEAARPIDEVDFTRPTAIVFGNERDGVGEEMLAAADVRCMVPMHGFVQSFNISVAAAISLYHILRDRTERLGHHGDLSPEERHLLKAVFYVRAVNEARRLIPRLVGR